MQTFVETSASEAECTVTCIECRKSRLPRESHFISCRTQAERKRLRVVADSQSAIKLSNTELVNRRRKSIDIAYYYERDVLSQKVIFIEYVVSKHICSRTSSCNQTVEMQSNRARESGEYYVKGSFSTKNINSKRS